MILIIHGAGGQMGKLICSVASSQGHTVLAVDPSLPTDSIASTYASIADYTGNADCIIDFSHHSASKALLEDAVSRKLPLVMATTGLTESELAAVDEASRSIPLIQAANFSVGVALMRHLAAEVAKVFPDADVEIVEAHHNRKKDVPSGTALLLADTIAQKQHGKIVVGRHTEGRREPREIGVHALRIGTEAGTHQVFFATGNQTLVLEHRAEDRSLFADGALRAAAFLQGKPAGRYTMDDMLREMETPNECK